MSISLSLTILVPLWFNMNDLFGVFLSALVNFDFQVSFTLKIYVAKISWMISFQDILWWVTAVLIEMISY